MINHKAKYYLAVAEGMLGSLWDTYREGQWRDTRDRYRLDKLKGKKKN